MVIKSKDQIRVSEDEKFTQDIPGQRPPEMAALFMIREVSSRNEESVFPSRLQSSQNPNYIN